MSRKILVIIGGFMSVVWGISHLIPTRAIVKDFGPISPDNQRIILMEWINEGLALIYIGFLVVAATLGGKEADQTAKRVYVVSSLMLFSMAVLSAFTGFKIAFLPFRLCPVIFSISGLFILQGAFRK